MTNAQRASVVEELAALEAIHAMRAAYRFRQYFPDCTPNCRPSSLLVKDHVIRTGDRTPICRVLYAKHLAFFAAGKTYRERLFLKANRVGGTAAAAYEITCHLTGIYPHWWAGRRFADAGEWWASGRTGITTRDIVQLELYGAWQAPKTGMLPAHLILHTSPKSGIPQALDTIWVKHVTGKTASLQFKSFEQGRTGFEGTAKQGIWLDEECEEDVVGECLLRTMTTDGMLIYTFTPLQGLTTFVEGYIEQADMHSQDEQGRSIIVQAKDTFWDGKKGDQ